MELREMNEQRPCRRGEASLRLQKTPEIQLLSSGFSVFGRLESNPSGAKTGIVLLDLPTG
jgi:hypothetical protein